MCYYCYVDDYYGRNPEKLEEKRLYARERANRITSSLTWEQRATRRGSGDRRLLSYNYIKQLRDATSYCLCCDALLDFGFYPRNKLPQNSATLDKIIPNLGYIDNNVAIVCKKCNRQKNNLSLEEAKQIVKYLEANIKK